MKWKFNMLPITSLTEILMDSVKYRANSINIEEY